MASRRLCVLAAGALAAARAAEEFAPLEEAARAERQLAAAEVRELGGWSDDGWSSSSSSSSSSGSSGKSGKSTSYDDDDGAWGGWDSSSWSGSSSSSGKSGKSGSSGSGKSGKGSSSSHSGHHWHGGWGMPGWWGNSSSSSKSSKGSGSKSSKGSGYKSSKGSSSDSSSSWDGGWGGWDSSHWSGSSSSSSGKSGKSGSGSGKSGKGTSTSHDYWGPPPSWGGWDSSSSSSGKSGKGSSKSSKGSKGSKSGSKSSGGKWVWVWGSAPSWGSGSSSSSGKSGKSGGTISGSGSSGSGDGWDDDGWSTSADHDDDDWTDDGWKEPEPTDIKIYSKGGVLGGWKADGWDSDGHYKADFDYVRATVKQLIVDSDRELVPKFLRLGFHDCVGGCDGCVDLTNPENKGLLEPIEAIYPIVQQFEASYSKADIWALATLVAADMAVLEDRPEGLHFPMRYVGRDDCDGADAMGVGGPDVTMPDNHLTTHELLTFFKDEFDFSTEETVVIMGVHSAGVLHPTNSGFGNKGKEDGWVFDAESYKLDNRYYHMLVGDGKGGPVPEWEMELVENDGDIPDRYQWYHEKDGEDERPIMTNADMALVHDFSGHIGTDAKGNEGAVDCVVTADDHGDDHRKRRKLGDRRKTMATCPMADDTMEFMVEYALDNQGWLVDFEKVLEKMLKNGH